MSKVPQYTLCPTFLFLIRLSGRKYFRHTNLRIDYDSGWSAREIHRLYFNYTVSNRRRITLCPLWYDHNLRRFAPLHISDKLPFWSPIYRVVQ